MVSATRPRLSNTDAAITVTGAGVPVPQFRFVVHCALLGGSSRVLNRIGPDYDAFMSVYRASSRLGVRLAVLRRGGDPVSVGSDYWMMFAQGYPEMWSAPLM